MSQFIESITAVGDFDGTVNGLISFASFSDASRKSALVVDGLMLSTTAPNAGFQWAEAYFRRPGSTLYLFLGAATVAEMLLPSGTAFVARWCPGIVPRDPDGTFFDIAFVTSGVGAETVRATAYFRGSMDAGSVIVGADS